MAEERIPKDEAVLSLDENGKKKTWLLTGFDIKPAKKKKAAQDENGKVSARHASTQAGPIFSRSDMGAYAAFKESIDKIMRKVNDKSELVNLYYKHLAEIRKKAV